MTVIGVLAVLAIVALVISLRRHGSMSGPVDGKWAEWWYVDPKVRRRLALQKDREEA